MYIYIYNMCVCVCMYVLILLSAQLSPEEADFLKANSSQDLAAFVAVNDDISETFVKNAIK